MLPDAKGGTQARLTAHVTTCLSVYTYMDSDCVTSCMPVNSVATAPLRAHATEMPAHAISNDNNLCEAHLVWGKDGADCLPMAIGARHPKRDTVETIFLQQIITEVLLHANCLCVAQLHLETSSVNCMLA